MQKEPGSRNDKKKILIITNHSYMLWQFRRELIFELMKTHEIVLSLPFVGHEEDFQAHGLRCIETKIDRRGMNLAADFRLLRTYEKILKQERPDLVVTYSIKPNIYAGWLCGRLGIPFCANVQGLGTAFQAPVFAFLATVMYRQAFRKVQAVFFENEANAEAFRNRRILTAEKQTVLHGAGINLEHYGLAPWPGNEKVRFLYLGRIMQEKGVDELFSAVRRLREERDDFVLDLVGFFEDKYESAYREQVAQLEQAGVVAFHGFQEDPRPYYAAADCVVLPSYHEGMSNVLLEAAATGRPLITSDIPGCREAVDRDETGFLVTVKDTDSLLEAMRRFLALTPEARKAMGQAGRRKMEREFRKELVVEETIQVLDKYLEPEAGEERPEPAAV